MSFSTLPEIPVLKLVKRVTSSRYQNIENVRPESWDLREEGRDIIETEDGLTLCLWSDGGQSPPQPGWKIMISDGDSSTGYHWTLYGLSRSV